jgi:hypothetical protein
MTYNLTHLSLYKPPCLLYYSIFLTTMAPNPQCIALAAAKEKKGLNIFFPQFSYLLISDHLLANRLVLWPDC